MRAVIAFLVAPLVVPLFLLPSLYSGMPDRFWFAVTLIVATIAAYAGTFFFGLPAYLFLRARWDPLESTCRHASLSIL